ncbi:MAG TPA: hypothetical protein PKV80_29395, partial [Leptospiraceae bacterium]|nr:hypothetical protein [Leptospiraceae bacterium]
MKWTRRIDTGNAGATVDLWYRRAAVVLWKCEDHLSVLAEGLDKSATVTLLLKYAKSKSPEFTNKELISCANSIIKSWNPGKYRSPSADLNDKMLKVLNLLSDTDITRQFFRNILSLEYSRSNAGKISESLYHHGLEKFKTELESFVNPDSDRLKSDFPELLLHLTESAKGNTKYLQIC